MRAIEHWLGQRISLLGPGRRAAYREVLGRAAPLAEGGAVAAFDLARIRLDRDRGRDAHRLVSLFRESGHFLAFVDRYPFVSSLGALQYKRLLLEHPFAIVPTADALPPGSRLVTDRSGGQSPRELQILRVRYDDGFEPGSSRVAVPYGPHPVVAEAGRPQTSELLGRKRRWRLFFAGNSRPGKYDRPRWGKLPRVEVLDVVRSTLPEEQQRRVGDQQTLERLGRDAPFVGFANVDFSSLYVPETHWLSTLADAEFFLACPGVRMPMCHNVIEALSVGAVPLLEYPEYFHPALRDGENCIAFAGKDDLVRKLEHVLALPAEEVDRLRRGALRYFERHLTADAFSRQLDAAEPPVELYPLAHLAPEPTAC